MNDIIKLTGTYPLGHPLKGIYDNCYRGGEEPCLPEAIPHLNALNAFARTMDMIRTYSHEAFSDFMNDKLLAKDGDGINWHNFISALCELSVIYTFILCSDERDSFLYEPRLIPGKQTNPEFSIRIDGISYNVEVKSPNLLKQRLETQKLIQEQGMVLEADVRLWSLEQTKEIVGDDVPIMGSLDNKLADFLSSAQKKFPLPADDSTINLLVVCWDTYLEQACAAFKHPASGLLTASTYKKMEDGTPVMYPNVTHIMINTMYQGLIDWFCGDPYMKTGFSPWGADPFNMRNYKNVIVDYNLDNPNDIKGRLDKLVDNQMLVIDEEYASTHCDEQRWILH